MVKHSRAFLPIGVAGAVLVGIGTATQSRINSELSRALGDGYLAALISFGSGLVIMLIVLALWAPGRRGARRLAASVRAGSTPWWYLLGGAGGGLFVLSQGLTGAVLGVALFTIAVVSGQTISGLIVDRRGIGTTPPAAITITRLVGSLLALVAVGWAVSSESAGNQAGWMLALPFIAGLAISVQQALNGQVRLVAGSAMTATLLNFVVGATVLALALAAHVIIAGLHVHFPTNPVLYLGGLVGTLFIGGAVVVVRITGVLLLGLASVAGQLVMSLALDALLPLPGQVIEWTTVAGTILAIVAVAITAVPSRRLSKGAEITGS